jgi:hypothetical protein
LIVTILIIHLYFFQEKETLCEGSCVKKIVFDGLFKEGTKKYNKNFKKYIYAVFPKRIHGLLRMNVKLSGDIIQFETYLRVRPWIISRFVNPRPSFILDFFLLVMGFFMLFTKASRVY